MIERLSTAAPRYALVLEKEAGLRAIIEKEISHALGSRIEGCSPEVLSKHPDTADEHLDAIRPMKDSGTVAVASYSPAFLRTAQRLDQRSFGREALISRISFSRARARELPDDGLGFLRFADGTTA